ncbi:MAG: hypothetical protein H6974_09460 [Gammaproteobacteria bacterium]|nr:hypothetical protein [Gammaproteobacteria bacterium]
MNALQSDDTTLVVIALVIMAIVIAFVFRQKIRSFFRQNLSAWLQANPWVQWVFSGIGVVTGAAILSGLFGAWESSPPLTPSISPAAVVKDSESRKGKIWVEDATGRGAEVDHSKAESDIIVTTNPLPGNTSPKE